eukprot:gb/GECG01000131.1/.p1 GENE.gb/GECG01000131.1/~~gb/GECG01000131.1/.p1  ORF type:complete len:600 (+),score=56.78 gb/GECG01000131.1/:1-1800(+)
MASMVKDTPKADPAEFQPNVPDPNNLPKKSPLDAITQELFDYLAAEHNVLLIDPHEPIGRGAFAVVYKAVKLPEKEVCAAKCMYLEVAEQRLRQELQMLSLFRMDQQPNCSTLLDFFKAPKHLVALLPYVETIDYRELLHKPSVEHYAAYLYTLFEAIHQAHSLALVHRDVKPKNFCWNPKTYMGMLVDFGLCEQHTIFANPDSSPREHSQKREILQNSRTPPALIHRGFIYPWRVSKALDQYQAKYPSSRRLQALKDFTDDLTRRIPNANEEQAHSSAASRLRVIKRLGLQRNKYVPKMKRQAAERAGTPSFRAPEILLSVSMQSQAIDIWSAGCIAASLWSGRYPFFPSDTDESCLHAIATLVGFDRVICAAARQYKAWVCTNKLMFRAEAAQQQRIAEDTRGARLARTMYFHCNIYNPGIPTDPSDQDYGKGEMNPLTNNTDTNMSSTAIRQLCSVLRPEWRKALNDDTVLKYPHGFHTSKAEQLVQQKKVTSPTEDPSYRILSEVVGKCKYASPPTYKRAYDLAPEALWNLSTVDYSSFQSIMIADMLWLVERCLDPDPVSRITAEEALHQSRFLQVGQLAAKAKQRSAINSLVR